MPHAATNTVAYKCIPLFYYTFLPSGKAVLVVVGIHTFFSTIFTSARALEMLERGGDLAAALGPPNFSNLERKSDTDDVTLGLIDVALGCSSTCVNVNCVNICTTMTKA